MAQSANDRCKDDLIGEKKSYLRFADIRMKRKKREKMAMQVT
jgi:hypothetical protein